MRLGIPLTYMYLKHIIVEVTISSKSLPDISLLLILPASHFKNWIVVSFVWDFQVYSPHVNFLKYNGPSPHLTWGRGADHSTSYLQANLKPSCIYTEQPQACPGHRYTPARPSEQKTAWENPEKQNVMSPSLFCVWEQVMAATSSTVAKKNLSRKCFNSNNNSVLQSNNLTFCRMIIKLCQVQFSFPKVFPFLLSAVYTWMLCYKKPWGEGNVQWLVH